MKTSQASQPNQPNQPSQLNHKLRTPKALLIRLLASAGFGFLFLFLMIYHNAIQNSVSKNDEKILSLIDELGSLSQDNFTLSMHVESQEAVLQSIESEFSSLMKAIEESGGDASQVESIFSALLSKGSADLNLSKDIVLAGEDDTFDILILGTNGAHTDTIMIASVNEELEKISIFSVPRDLYVNGRRINAYYTYYGIDQLSRMLESITGLKIDKYAQVDLKGFVEVVDTFDGLEIVVEKSIYDASYPSASGITYSPYSIEAGTHNMSGEEALKYARSRKSTSDFDRAKRQQTILIAFKEKLLELNKVLVMKEFSSLLQTALAHVKTDANLLDLISYYYEFKDYKIESGLVLSTENYLYSMINESGAYILLPKSGNFEEIKSIIDEFVN